MQTFNYHRVFFLAKLLSPFVAAFLFFCTGLMILQYVTGGQMLEEQLRKRIIDELNFLEYEYREDGAVELLEEIEERLEKVQQSWRFLYAVQSPEGDSVFDVLPTQPELGWSRIRGLEYAESSLILSRELDGGYRLSVGLAENDLNDYRSTFITNAGWMLFVGAAGSILFSIFMYRRFIIIIRTLGLPVQQFSDGHFNVRIPQPNGGPDLDNLALNINTMFDQVERLITQLKTLTANIAHDLRTPLTRVRYQLTLALESANEETQHHLTKAEGEIDDVLRLFREILQLSEIQSGRLQTHFVKVNLSEIIEACIVLYQPLLEENNVTCDVTLPKYSPLKGSPSLLKQVMINLLENTLSHTSGNCTITFDLVLAKESLQLTVKDNGELKANKITKSHFGLGLNFIKAIVELHRGKVYFDNNQNVGFVCRITLPLENVV